MTTPIAKLPPYNIKEVSSALSEVSNWGIDLLGVPETWDITMGEDITGMIIDTGNTSHTDLSNSILTEKAKSFISHETSVEDYNGHATHCAGIIAADKNSFGVVGVAPKCKLILVKALDKDGTGDAKSILDALNYAIEIKPDFVSMSLGMYSDVKYIHNAIKKLYKMNIPVIAAAGNDGNTNKICFPAAYKETICVGALDRNLVKAGYSNTGKEVDFSMPGSDIYSTFLNNRYVMMSGTSMATPFLAGVIALMLSKHKKQERETGKNDCRTVQDIVEHLKKYSIDKGTVGKDAKYGFGVVNPKDVIFETQNSTESIPTKVLVPKNRRSLLKTFFVFIRKLNPFR